MLIRLLAITTSILPLAAFAQHNIGKGEVADLFKQHCASCHGQDLKGGLGGSLLKAEWKHIGEDLSFIDFVSKGYPQLGMPPFGHALSRKDIRGLEIYVAEMQEKARREVQHAATTPKEGGVYEAGSVRFKLETVVSELEQPWALSFLPDGRGLFTLKKGQLRILNTDGSTQGIKGTPKDIWRAGQGGMLEVAPHPDYAENGWIYLGYSVRGAEVDGKMRGFNKVIRGRLQEGEWVDEETIFEVPLEFHRPKGCLLYTSPSPRDGATSRMPSSA